GIWTWPPSLRASNMRLASASFATDRDRVIPENEDLTAHWPSDAITDESPSGWRTLYVVLTRATQRLTTVGTTERWLQRLR
ncbi:MAG: hypothetical protein ACXWDB_05715, partial [Aeromicrobium sp.]